MREFAAALTEVCTSLARQIVADGEGITHVVELRIDGAATDADALRVAKAIAHSPLVKTAWAGCDPNWGRLVAAIGYSGAEIDPERIDIWFGEQRICRNGGRAAEFDEKAAHAYLRQEEFSISIDLQPGDGIVRLLDHGPDRTNTCTSMRTIRRRVGRGRSGSDYNRSNYLRFEGQPGTMSNRNRSQNGTGATATTQAEGAFSLISNEKLISLYANLLKCRLAGERLGAKNNGAKEKGETGSTRAYEAGTVGVAIDLGSDDAICATHHGLLTGVPEEAPIQAFLLASGRSEFAGRLQAWGTKPDSTSRNGVSPKPNPSYTHAAIGTALANKTKKNGKVAVVFGDGETSESWHEALQIASTHGLPMVFVNQVWRNPNGSVRRFRTPDKEEAAGPESAWFPAITVDSNDVVAVYRVANEAISRARLGRGPTLIECRHFRLHGKPADGNKAARNGRHWQDPILNMQHYLRAKGLLRPGLKSEILSDWARELGTK